jgi:prepilin-type N-terminal cleavage/methylation domain-containing protein
MRLLHKNQKGLTLIEILIAVTIMAGIAVAADGVIVQLIQSNRTSSHMVAVRQVQQAGHRVSQDCIQAQDINASNVTGSGGFPLTLKWTAWEGGEDHTVVYNLTGSGELRQLQRKETVDTNTTTAGVAQYIYFNATSPNSTECSWNATEKVLTLSVTARVNLETESRTYEIKPRTCI